jgi:hypothetical protein
MSSKCRARLNATEPTSRRRDSSSRGASLEISLLPHDRADFESRIICSFVAAAFCSVWCAAHDTRAIQGWLGHRSIISTAVYTALAPNRFKDFWRD